MKVWFASLSSCPRARRTIRFDTPHGLTYEAYIYTLQRTIPSVRRCCTTLSPHRSHRKCRNINRLPIDFAFQLRLRSRLTLIRLTLIRKPWSFGGRVSLPPYRYLCLHLLFLSLQQPLQVTFNATGMLPYHSAESTASAVCLMPDYYPRSIARLVSCYALFKCMAASKPTS